MPEPTETIDEQTEAIMRRMFRHRLDQWHEHHRGWQSKYTRDFRPTTPREFVKSLLAQGMRVTAGYYPTSVRGVRDYIVLWRERK